MRLDYRPSKDGWMLIKGGPGPLPGYLASYRTPGYEWLVDVVDKDGDSGSYCVMLIESVGGGHTELIAETKGCDEESAIEVAERYMQQVNQHLLEGDA